MKRILSRRMVLRGAAGAALALPLLDDIPRAHAQAKSASDAGAAAGGGADAAVAAGASPKRLFVMFSPNGGIDTSTGVQFNQSTGSGATFTPGPIYQQLVTDGFKNDITVLHGLDMGVALIPGVYGDAHGLGIGCMLTGTELASGNMFVAGMGGAGSGWPGGISVDQFIAQKMPQRPRASVDFAIKRFAANIWSRMSYTGPGGKTVEPFDDPTVAFNTLFANVGMSASTVNAQTLRRKSVLDQVNSELNALLPSLSGRDKDRVNNHIALLQSIESSLSIQNAVGCTAPPSPMGLAAPVETTANNSGMEALQPPANDADVPLRHKLARQMIVAAMACDMARVGTIIMAPSRSDVYLTWLTGGDKESHHNLSHEGNTNMSAAQELMLINQWYGAQVSEMIKLLKATPEGNGTMFDNSVILWCNELGVGNVHSHTNIPMMLAGNAGGYFKTGQAVTVANDSSHVMNAHNRLLLSLIHSMGFADVTTFGDAKYCAGGPIQEIMA